MVWLVAWLVLGAGKAAPPPRQEPARLALATAAAFSRAQRWDDALSSADEALRLEPDWPEALYSRAAIRIGKAGPQAQLPALTKAQTSPDLALDYSAISELLSGAAADLRRFLSLAPKTKDRELALTTLAELDVCARLAADVAKVAAARRVARDAEAAAQKAEAAHRAAGRVKVDATHWCLPGQAFIGDRCRGVPNACPRNQVPDGMNETCRWQDCPPGKQQLTGGFCCWPGQAWSEERSRSRVQKGEAGEHLGCTGVPTCPAGFEPRPDLDLAEACLPMKGKRERERSESCEYRTDRKTDLYRFTYEGHWHSEYSAIKCSFGEGSHCAHARLLEKWATSLGCVSSNESSAEFCCP